ncbi:MAG: hypothetical protein LBV69_01065 [Bacteroidales bacterium]|jgi:hypothetical protein|nr:hypothetical protein [Bacteroidales bacterium]
MKKQIIFLFFLSASFLNLLGQEFSVVKEFEIKNINPDIFYNYSPRMIKSKDKTIMPLNPIYDITEDSLSFLIIDSTLKTSIIKWKYEKDSYGDEDGCYSGLHFPNDNYLLMGDKVLYSVKQINNSLKTQKKIKLPNGEGKEYKNISYIDYPEQKYVLLTSTYNSCRFDTIHDVFRLAKFNLKKGKIEKKVSIDVGKGIFLGHYSNYNWIANSSKIIALANPVKSEIYLFDNNLTITDTIKINYPSIYNTGKIIDSILSNQYILENKGYSVNIIQMMVENNIHKLPKIENIVFWDDDLLLIQINSNCDDMKNLDCLKQRLYFVYSVSQQKFYNENGLLLSDFDIESFLPFSKNSIWIFDSVDNDDKIKYFAHVDKISIDFDSKYISKIDTTLLSVINLESYNSETQKINFSDFDNIMIADIAACSHCKYDNKYKNIMIIHVYPDEYECTKSEKLLNKRKYEQIFDSPKVFFLKNSLLDANLRKNTIYKIR